MNTITKEQALARANRIAKKHPIEPISKAESAQFVTHMKKYFPEFTSFPHLWTVYTKLPSNGVGDVFAEFDPDDSGVTKYVFDIDAAAEHRFEMYVDGYEYFDPEMLGEMYSFLSFGRTSNESWSVLNRECHALSQIWDVFRDDWPKELAKLKIGAESDIVEQALEAGVDINVDAYLSDVPIEYLIEKEGRALSR